MLRLKKPGKRAFLLVFTNLSHPVNSDNALMKTNPALRTFALVALLLSTLNPQPLTVFV